MSPDTDARVFVAQLTRDIAARQARGAGTLSPGATTWWPALQGFANGLAACKGPVKAAAAVRAAVERLRVAQKDGACFVNGTTVKRSRSAGFEILTWEREPHPLLDRGHEGIVVRGYCFTLRRNGVAEFGRSKLAYVGWHALARMRERSRVDVFAGGGVVATCGVAGLPLRESERHHNTEVNLSFEGLLCTGVLRVADDADGRYAFFDVLTTLEPNERNERKYQQGFAVTHAALAYVAGDSADPTGRVGGVDVIPHHGSDFVSREMRARSGVQPQLAGNKGPAVTTAGQGIER